MPIKKDGTGKRWVEMELLVPGTPEQVWHAMATGPGYATWFVKGEIEPRVGGKFSLDFGQGFVTTGEVTAWEPPHQFGYVEREWQPGAPPVATEITIVSRSGDSCFVRMVHSLFTSLDDWDDQLEGFEYGWQPAFAVLRAYLRHFAGAQAASFVIMTPVIGDSLSVWSRLGEPLGFTGASVGERRTAASGPESWSGVVDHLHQDTHQRYVLLRLDAPSPGMALVAAYDKDDKSHKGEKGAPSNSVGATTMVSISRYFYGEGVDSLATEGQRRWRDWFGKTFEIAQPPAEK